MTTPIATKARAAIALCLASFVGGGCKSYRVDGPSYNSHVTLQLDPFFWGRNNPPQAPAASEPGILAEDGPMGKNPTDAGAAEGRQAGTTVYPPQTQK
jgi:hypothetical protein